MASFSDLFQLIDSLWTALGATVAGWRRFYRTGIIVSFLLAGCTSWNQLMPIPPELTEAGVQALASGSTRTRTSTRLIRWLM